MTVLVLIVLFLQDHFSWARISFGRVLAYPEVRYHRYPTKFARVEQEFFFEDVFAVENRGEATAENVYIFAINPGGRITRYDIVSAEPYTVTETADQVNRVGISLEHLTPGSNAILYVWSANGATSSSKVHFSATVEQGTAKPSSELTAVEEVESYVSRIRWIATQALHLLQRLNVIERLQ